MQLRHQAGHEVFHWLRTPAERTPGILHWTHEMLAIEVSHRAMRAAAIPGCAEYLNDSDTYYRALAPGRGLEFGHRPSTPVGMSSI
jgi:hypothetical protein